MDSFIDSGCDKTKCRPTNPVPEPKSNIPPWVMLFGDDFERAFPKSTIRKAAQRTPKSKPAPTESAGAPPSTAGVTPAIAGVTAAIAGVVAEYAGLPTESAHGAITYHPVRIF